MLAAASTVASPACGSGVVTSDDVSGGEGVVVAIVAVVAVLFVALIGNRKP